MTPDTLNVVWQSPPEEGGTKHVIGHLAIDRRTGFFEFRYGDSLQEAKDKGFVLLPEFPKQETIYTNYRLFATFIQRVPKDLHQKPWAKGVWSFLGPEKCNGAQFEHLRLTGGKTATDRLEFVDPHVAHWADIAPFP